MKSNLPPGFAWSMRWCPACREIIVQAYNGNKVPGGRIRLQRIVRILRRPTKTDERTRLRLECGHWFDLYGIFTLPVEVLGSMECLQCEYNIPDKEMNRVNRVRLP